MSGSSGISSLVTITSLMWHTLISFCYLNKVTNFIVSLASSTCLCVPMWTDAHVTPVFSQNTPVTCIKRFSSNNSRAGKSSYCSIPIKDDSPLCWSIKKVKQISLNYHIPISKHSARKSLDVITFQSIVKVKIVV